jgi:DNA topoisomerase-6 subunit B
MQKEISVSEFFAKNRHLLGFDNKRKALLMTVKEAVDNSLDACEEAGQLPDIEVTLVQVAEERFRVIVKDNGPGIVKQQIPNVFGKLLYGSKFHRLKMSRGQQGIGISAAGMYGLLTTRPITTRSRSIRRRTIRTSSRMTRFRLTGRTVRRSRSSWSHNTRKAASRWMSTSSRRQLPTRTPISNITRRMAKNSTIRAGRK